MWLVRRIVNQMSRKNTPADFDAKSIIFLHAYNAGRAGEVKSAALQDIEVDVKPTVLDVAPKPVIEVREIYSPPVWNSLMYKTGGDSKPLAILPSNGDPSLDFYLNFSDPLAVSSTMAAPHHRERDTSRQNFLYSSLQKVQSSSVPEKITDLFRKFNPETRATGYEDFKVPEMELGITSHGVRHAAVESLLQAGFPAESVSALLGHVVTVSGDADARFVCCALQHVHTLYFCNALTLLLSAPGGPPYLPPPSPTFFQSVELLFFSGVFHYPRGGISRGLG